LPQVAEAFDPLRRSIAFGQRRKKQRAQQGDNGDKGQKFDQCKSGHCENDATRTTNDKSIPNAQGHGTRPAVATNSHFTHSIFLPLSQFGIALFSP